MYFDSSGVTFFSAHPEKNLTEKREDDTLRPKVTFKTSIFVPVAFRHCCRNQWSDVQNIDFYENIKLYDSLLFLTMRQSRIVKAKAF